MDPVSRLWQTKKALMTLNGNWTPVPAAQRWLWVTLMFMLWILSWSLCQSNFPDRAKALRLHLSGNTFMNLAFVTFYKQRFECDNTSCCTYWSFPLRSTQTVHATYVCTNTNGFIFVHSWQVLLWSQIIADKYYIITLKIAGNMYFNIIHFIGNTKEA